jgi:hypothetical protein
LGQLHALGVALVKPFTEHLGSDRRHVARCRLSVRLAPIGREQRCVYRNNFSPAVARGRSGALATRRARNFYLGVHFFLRWGTAALYFPSSRLN